MNNLKAKYSKERDVFNKRMQAHLEDLNNEWRLEKLSLNQRFNNNLKEQKASQEREMVSFRRGFTTKGGSFSIKYE